MNRLKEALIKFALSNPSLFQNDDTNSYPMLIEQRFSQFFADFRTPNHPPYAAMIHTAIRELNEKGGSSEESISKYIKQEYVDLPWAHSTLLKNHLEKLCDHEEICMTRKQRYSLAGAGLDPVSSSRSEKRLKRKQNSEPGKKSSRKRKKHKSRQDSESGKTRSRQSNKVKKEEDHQFDLNETNKQIIEVSQEQDLVLQPLVEVADEQENMLYNGLQEPLPVNIEDEKKEQGNGLVDIYIQDVEEGVIQAIAAGQNQPDIRKEGVGEKTFMITQFDVSDNENQSVEQLNFKEQIKISGGQLKLKQRLKSNTSKHVKKHEIKAEPKPQVLSEANLLPHNKVTDSESHEQNHKIEVNTSDTQIPVEIEVERSVNVGSEKQLERRKCVVAGEVNEDGESIQKSHPDKDGCISLGQIQKVNPELLQLEDTPDSNPVSLKSKHPRKQVWTRSQLKMKKDASASSELMVSPGYPNMPKDKPDVEYLSEEKQQEIQIIGREEAKRALSAVSYQMNVQRAKLRSSQMKQTKSRSPSPDRPLKELKNSKLSPQFPDLDEPTTEVQELDNSQQDQQSDESKDQLKYQRSGRHLQTKKNQKLLCTSESADISQHSHADEDKPKYKGRGRRPKPREPQKDETLSDSGSAAIPQKCKVQSRQTKAKRVCKHKSRDIQGQQSNEDDKPKNKHHGMHKMTRRSSSKKKNRSS